MYYLSGWIAKHCSLSVAFLISAIAPFIGLVTTLLKHYKVERGTVSDPKEFAAVVESGAIAVFSGNSDFH